MAERRKAGLDLWTVDEPVPEVPDPPEGMATGPPLPTAVATDALATMATAMQRAKGPTTGRDKPGPGRRGRERGG
jgi:hypothetical protein